MPNATPPVPPGMVAVTKQEFFAFVGPLDVSPNTMNPHFSEWTTRGGAIVGLSYPGWKNPGDAEAYMIVKPAR